MQHRTWVALVAAASFAVFPAAAPGAWLPAQTVGTGESGSDFNTPPRVAMNAGGDVAVATGSPNVPVALSTRATAAGAFTSVGLPAAFAGLKIPPAVALGDDGTTVLGLPSGDGAELWASDGPLAGPLAAPTTIPSGQYTSRPTVAVAGDGTVVAAWSVLPDPAVRWTIKAAGGSWGAVHGGSSRYGNLSVSDDGHALITYVGSDGAYAVSRAPGGDFGAPVRVSAPDDAFASFPDPIAAGAVAHGGAATVVFTTTAGVVLRRRASAGAAWSARTTLDSGEVSSLAMAGDDDGDFLIGYETQQTHSVLVSGQVDDADVASHDLGVAMVPAVAVAGDGTATAVWSAIPRRLMTTRRASGDDWTAPRAIDDAGDPAQRFGPDFPAATLAAGDDGDFVVGWQSLSGNYRVRRFDPAAPDVTASPPVFDEVSVPAAATTGQSVSMSARAHGDSPVTLSWVFSNALTDGFYTLDAAQGADVQPIFYRPVPHTVTVTAIDADGLATSATRTIAVTSATPPDPPVQDPPPPSHQDDPPPVQDPPPSSHQDDPPPRQDPPRQDAPPRDGTAPREPAPPRCVVPSLRSHTLAAAKAMLRRAHCALGRATKPRHVGRRDRLVVRSQSRAPRSVAAAGTKVHVTLRAVRR